jgi:hypothetical protein
MSNEEIELYSEILPALWQGGTDESESIYHGQKRLPTMSDPRPFDVVVSLCAYTQPVGWLVKEYRYAFADGEIEESVYQEIEQLADWTYQQWKSGSRVLIRCQAGLNRSGLLTSLVLIRDGFSLQNVIELIRSKRGEFALSNKHFMKYLSNRPIRKN